MELRVELLWSFVQSFYRVSCRAFTELRVEPLWSSVSSFGRAPCAIPLKSSAKLYIGIISLILDIFK